MFMSVLIVMLPIAFAEELNLIYDGNGNLVTGDSFYRGYFIKTVPFREANGCT